MTDVDLLNEKWSKRPAGRLQLGSETPPQVIELELQAGAEFASGAGELVAERRVGRGRIVTTAFSLSTREFVNWDPGFDNFFNGCLLRRPPRRFSYSAEAGLSVSWAEGLTGPIDDPVVGPRRESTLISAWGPSGNRRRPC